MLLQIMWSSHQGDQAIRSRPPSEEHRALKNPEAAVACGKAFAAMDALPFFPQQFDGRGCGKRLSFARLKLSIGGIPAARLLGIEAICAPGDLPSAAV